MAKVKASTVVQVSKKEVGYLEKKSNKYLNSKKLNAGRKNYTKYGKEMGCNGQSWCDAFVDWCFTQAFGKAVAKEMLGGFSNYTPTSAQNFKKMKRWYSTPKVGDVIFFENASRIYHTGLVVRVKDEKVYTVEGNTSSAKGVVENGGSVNEKSYSVKYTKIAGYGRPQYSKTLTVKTKKNPLGCYTKCSTASKRVGQFKKGTTVTVVRCVGSNWYKVTGKSTKGKTITGYSREKYLG